VQSSKWGFGIQVLQFNGEKKKVKGGDGGGYPGRTLLELEDEQGKSCRY